MIERSTSAFTLRSGRSRSFPASFSEPSFFVTVFAHFASFSASSAASRRISSRADAIASRRIAASFLRIPVSRLTVSEAAPVNVLRSSSSSIVSISRFSEASSRSTISAAHFDPSIWISIWCEAIASARSRNLSRREPDSFSCFSSFAIRG